jgi:hypothetical protein
LKPIVLIANTNSPYYEKLFFRKRRIVDC